MASPPRATDLRPEETVTLFNGSIPNSLILAVRSVIIVSRSSPLSRTRCASVASAASAGADRSVLGLIESGRCSIRYTCGEAYHPSSSAANSRLIARKNRFIPSSPFLIGCSESKKAYKKDLRTRSFNGYQSFFADSRSCFACFIAAVSFSSLPMILAISFGRSASVSLLVTLCVFSASEYL